MSERSGYTRVVATFHDDSREEIDVFIENADGTATKHRVCRVEWSDDERRYISSLGSAREFNLPFGTPVVVLKADPARVLIGGRAPK